MPRIWEEHLSAFDVKQNKKPVIITQQLWPGRCGHGHMLFTAVGTRKSWNYWQQVCFVGNLGDERPHFITSLKQALSSLRALKFNWLGGLSRAQSVNRAVLNRAMVFSAWRLPIHTTKWEALESGLCPGFPVTPQPAKDLLSIHASSQLQQ